MIFSLPLMDSTRNRENIEDVTVGNDLKNYGDIDSLCNIDRILSMINFLILKLMNLIMYLSILKLIVRAKT